MKTLVERSIQPISVQPMFDTKGLLVTVHGKEPGDNTVIALSLREARLLAYGILAEAERQDVD